MLIVEDDKRLMRCLTLAMEARGFEVMNAELVFNAIVQINLRAPEYAVVDLRLGGRQNQLEQGPAFAVRRCSKLAAMFPEAVTLSSVTVLDPYGGTQDYPWRDQRSRGRYTRREANVELWAQRVGFSTMSGTGPRCPRTINDRTSHSSTLCLFQIWLELQ